MNKARLSLCASLAIMSVSARATVIVSGDYLEITDRVSEPIVIADGGWVTVRDGEIIAPGQGLPNTGTVTLAVPSGSLRSTFEMKGRSFLTSTNSVPILYNYLSTLRLSDDALVVATHGNNAIQARGGNGSNFIYLEDRATVVGDVVVDAFVNIADEARITGRLTYVYGNITLAMSGGSINGGVYFAGGGDYAADISGGRIDNGFWFGPQTSVSRFNMSGGEIYGGFTALGSIFEGNIFDGSIYGGLRLNHYAPLSIWGGIINASEDGWLIDMSSGSPYAEVGQFMSIWGGQIGQLDAGRGIRLSGVGGIDVYGFDLSLTDGLLSGYLSDGNWLSVSISTASDWTGAINLHDVRKTVPEPSTALLFLTAVAGLFGCRRRKPAAL